MPTIDQFLIPEIFAFLLLFCRIGAGIMVLPGFGELYVPQRIKLLMALCIALLLTPTLQPIIPPVPDNPILLMVLITGEVLVGVFIGAMCRLFISAVHVAGMIIAYQSSLASALMMDFTQSTQGAAIGNMLTVLAVLLVFATNLHHVMLRGLVDSYAVFTPGLFPMVEDIAELASVSLDKAFVLAMQIASPHLVVGLVLYLGGGVLGRLMPTLQIFFLIMAPQILISFVLLMMMISSVMMWYIRSVHDSMAILFAQ